MLVPAISYKEELNTEFLKTVLDEKYKYFHMSYANTELKIDDSTWNKIQVVSVQDNNVNGYLSARIERPENFVSQVTAINFTNGKMQFGKDLYEFINMLLYRFNFPKVKFSCICGNPIIKTYDQLVKKYNGRVVGVFKNDTFLQDNKYHDVKWYEIFRENKGE